MKKNKGSASDYRRQDGFTLIELLVVVAIIGILTSITLNITSKYRGDSNNAKIKSQLKSMTNQALLFNGTTGTGYIVPAGASPTSSSITGAQDGGTSSSGTLFNDTNLTHYGLYNLINKLPSATTLYYGWDGNSTITGGKWFVAAGTYTGASCVDSSGYIKSWTGTTPSTTANFIIAFPNATTLNYSCN